MKFAEKMYVFMRMKEIKAEHDSDFPIGEYAHEEKGIETSTV